MVEPLAGDSRVGGGVKFFIESADVDAIEDLLDAGLCDGVVLNLGAASESPKALRTLVERLFELAVGPVIVPVAGGSSEAMLARARALGALGDDLVVSLPFTRDGLVACGVAFDEGIATHVGPCFGPAQVLLAAKAGATWAAMSVAAAEALGADGAKLVDDAVALLERHDYETQVVATGVTDALRVSDVALTGCHAAQLSPETIWRIAAPGLPATEAAPRSSRRR